MDEKTSFGDLLKSFRARMGWTQDELAIRVGVSRSTYNKWEGNKSIPTYLQLTRLAALLRLNSQEEHTFYSAAAHTSPRICELPLPRNTFFTGRETQLHDIRQLFKQNRQTETMQPIGITGLGGIGKTQLALEYAYRHYKDGTYPTVLWISASEKAEISSSFRVIDRLLPVRKFAQSASEDEKSFNDMLLKQPTEVMVNGTKIWLSNHTDWLLVIDNIDDIKEAFRFIPLTISGDILFTSRSQIVRRWGVSEQIVLKEFTDKEGTEFLMRRSGATKYTIPFVHPSKRIDEDAQWLVSTVGGHALALEQIGAYIEESGTSFSDYIQLFKLERQSLLDTHSLIGDNHTSHPETVASTILLSFKRACEINHRSGDILYFCVSLPLENMPEEVLHHNNDIRPNIKSFDAAISALRRYSLIERNAQDKTYSMHPLVREVITNSMPDDLMRQWRREAIHSLAYICYDLRDKNEYVKLRFGIDRDIVNSWEDDDNDFYMYRRVYLEWLKK